MTVTPTEELDQLTDAYRAATHAYVKLTILHEEGGATTTAVEDAWDERVEAALSLSDYISNQEDPS